MKMLLNQQIINYLLLGSAFYSTGGGIELGTQQKLFANLLAKTQKLALVSLNELEDSDYLCTAYAVGSAGNTSYDLSSQLRIGMEALEKVTQKKFKALFVGETNAEIVAFQAAASLELPVVDADSTGGRAVPEIQQDNFAVVGKSILPLVAVTPDQTVHILKNALNFAEIEAFVRGLSQQNPKGLVAVLDHPIASKQARSILTSGTVSRSLRLGKLLSKKFISLESVCKESETVVIFKGYISAKQLHSKEGFLQGFLVIREKGSIAKVGIKNENIICWVNDEVVYSSPDSIIMIDAETFRGIHNSKIRNEQEVIVLMKKASKLWRSKKGKDIFDPGQLGFSIGTIKAKS